MNVISIGEVLWDIVGQEEHLGGATFNFSAHLSRLGHSVSFVSAVGSDELGQKVIGRMSGLGLTTDYLGIDKDHPTGTASVALASDGQPKFVLHRPAAYDFPRLTTSQYDRLFSRPVDWIYFGTLHQIYPQARQLTSDLLGRASGARRFYDVNLRADGFTPTLIQELMSKATIVKLNHEEVDAISLMLGSRHSSLEEFCRNYADACKWAGVCVTRGSLGCTVFIDGQYIEAPGYPVQVVDTVGSGDAFAAAFLHGLGNGWPIPRIADFANRVGALVASRRGAIPDWTIAEANALETKTVRLETA
ncbi:MAG TPA: carbohydrate kinase [Terriglobales bacterium]|nr:carbohydrate kinase [Terriglobales bacterium]